MKTILHIQKGSQTEQMEVNVDKISFQEGCLHIGQQAYEIITDPWIPDDNTPVDFLRDAGDGEPRLVCHWRGLENYYSMDDFALKAKER